MRETTLEGAERDRVLADLGDALARIEEPQPVGIADCGYGVMRVSHQTVTLNCGRGDPGWSDAYDELRRLWDSLNPP